MAATCSTPLVSIVLYLSFLFLAKPVAAQENEADDVTDINSGLVSGLKLRNIGPALTSGRIGKIAVDPVKRSTRYVAVSSGGVWKTENAGTTWKPIFDSYGSYSIGTGPSIPVTGSRCGIWCLDVGILTASTEC